MALIKTSSEIQNFVKADTGTELSVLLPDLDWVEEKFIKKYLGTAQYDDLHFAYNDDSLTTAEGYLLEKVQRTLVNLAFAKFVIINQVNLSNTGIHITVDGNNKTAFEWQIEQIIEYFLSKGNDYLDSLLAFLEENKTSYPLWAASTAFTIHKKHFLTSASDFSNYYGIQESRRTFMALLPIIKKVEDFTLEFALGTAYYAELKAQLLAATITADNQVIIDKIKPALAYYTISRAIGPLAFAVQGTDLVFNVFRFDNKNSKEADGGATELLSLKKTEAERDGDTYLKKLKDYLNTEAAANKYATYFSSPAYTAPTDGSTTTFTNSADNKFFYAG